MHDSRNGMSIRGHYIQAFETIRNRYGEEGSGWEINPDVSLKQAIGYTRQYVIGHDKPHFRYDYYRDALDWAFSTLRFGPGNGDILCMDLGCGPGLFSWVVQDYMVSRSVRKGDIEIIGYDHANNMIRLLNMFHDCFCCRCSPQHDWHGYFRIGRLKRALKTRCFSNHDVIVTLGHVLIQIKDNPRAMRDFSCIIGSMFPFKSCVVIAADAYSSLDRRQAFRDSCEGLWDALREAGMDSTTGKLSDMRSHVCARLHMRA